MKKVEIVCILDRSGSMRGMQNDAIGGFNSFIEQQLELPGKAYLTLVQFSNSSEVTYENIDINELPKLTTDNYKIGGSTALLDTLGKTIDSIGNRLHYTSKNNRPDKVIFVILTDGEENSSTKYSLSKVKEMVRHQKDKYNWEFIYLGANQDAFLEADKFGIDSKDVSNFEYSKKGFRTAYGLMGSSVASYRL